MGNSASKSESFKKITRSISSSWLETKDKSHFLSKIGVQSLETVRYVWFDKNIHEDIRIKSAIKFFKKHLKNVFIMHDRYSFEQWLIQRNNKEKIFLITSNEYGKLLIPNIHHLQSIVIIYIHFMNNTINTKWTKNYYKVHNVIPDPIKLAKQVYYDIQDLKRITNFNSQHNLAILDTCNCESSHIEDILGANEGSRAGMILHLI